MAELRSYLVGLRDELWQAERSGRDTVPAIQAEIAHVEKQIALREQSVSPADRAAGSPAATTHEKTTGYLAALRTELADSKKLKRDNVPELEEEIARVEKLLSTRANPKPVEHATTKPRG